MSEILEVSEVATFLRTCCSHPTFCRSTRALGGSLYRKEKMCHSPHDVNVPRCSK